MLKVVLNERIADFAIPKFKIGILRPVIDSILDWNKANEAHNLMEQNKNAGRNSFNLTITNAEYPQLLLVLF